MQLLPPNVTSNPNWRKLKFSTGPHITNYLVIHNRRITAVVHMYTEITHVCPGVWYMGAKHFIFTAAFVRRVGLGTNSVRLQECITAQHAAEFGVGAGRTKDLSSSSIYHHRRSAEQQ